MGDPRPDRPRSDRVRDHGDWDGHSDRRDRERERDRGDHRGGDRDRGYTNDRRGRGDGDSDRRRGSGRPDDERRRTDQRDKEMTGDRRRPEGEDAGGRPAPKSRWSRVGQNKQNNVEKIDGEGRQGGGSKPSSRSGGNNDTEKTRGHRNDDDEDDESKERVEEVEKPNFESTGALSKEANTMNGVVLKWCEPPEARKPKTKWTIFPFKGDETLDPMKIYGKASYLLGRERRVVDIPLDHPSCSSQHAVICFRLVDFQTRDGVQARQIKPFLLDLESSNGTMLNGSKIESRRYIELRRKDVIKFASSTREYVVVNDKS